MSRRHSVDTAGGLDVDRERERWCSGMGLAKFEFVSNADVSGICRMISEKVL